jgi:hypothetical protein
MARLADDVFAETMSPEMLHTSNARARLLIKEFDEAQPSQFAPDHAQYPDGEADTGPTASDNGAAT